MENEIIIDGVNVAECEFYDRCNYTTCMIGIQDYIDCDKNPNCYFKQLQRAKAENEKLKNRNKLYKKIIKENIEKANNNFMILTACIQGNLTVDEVKEHAKLNAKNDELKRKLKSYKQALEDIKVDFINHNARNGITKFENEIFLKISEVLDD